MAADDQHIIKRVNAELQLSSAEGEAARSEQLEEAVMQAVKKLGPLLNEVSGDTFCQLDLLSVEFNLQSDDWPRLEKLLQDVLTRELGKVMAGNQAQANQKASEIKLHKADPEQRLQELVLHFLATGQIPWWSDEQSMEKIEKWLRDVPPDTWVDVIEPAVRQSLAVLHRLAVQFPGTLLDELIFKSTPEESLSKEIIQLIRNFKGFVETQNLPVSRQHQILTKLREYALQGVLFGQSRSVLLAMLMGTSLAGLSSDKSLLTKKWKIWLEESDSVYRDSWIAIIDERASEVGADQQYIEREMEQPIEEAQKEIEIKEDGLSVNNAGLVLLHPFFGRLFGNLGLLEDGDFTNHSARERGVCLLHYLASGEDKFLEPALTLPKFLCGWLLQQPVDRFLPISQYEKDECRSILNSAIEHWEALKSTTADGLRNNFLQRQGILKEQEFGWALHVERETQDVLLDKMPWGLSVIKFPWLDEMITVDW